MQLIQLYLKQTTWYQWYLIGRIKKRPAKADLFSIVGPPAYAKATAWQAGT